MHRSHLEKFMDTPVIISVKDEQTLEKSFQFDIPVVFLLYGDIVSLPKIVSELKKHGKTVLVHLDFISGLSNHEVVVKFIKYFCHADGIITTKTGLIAPAKKLGLITILRFFIIDHLSINNIVKQVNATLPDMVEIMPALIPKVISRLSHMIDVPIVTGGMITTKEDVIQALKAGALCVSTSTEAVWSM